MLLHHFTAEQHLKGIMRGGVSLGKVPSHFGNDGRPYFISGYQWLTSNPDFTQAWARPSAMSYLPYRRTQWRLLIEIPNCAHGRVIKWADFSAKFRPASADYINSFPDSVHWRLFHGTIPRHWIIAADPNPEPINIQFNEEVSAQA